MRSAGNFFTLSAGVFLFTLLFFLFPGCAGLRVDDNMDFDEAPLIGMIYDRNNQPVSGARVTIEIGRETGKGRKKTREELSSVNGRFIIANLPPGIHKALVSAGGYESNTVEFEFYSREQVLYIKLNSLDNLLDTAEEAAADRRYPEAAAYLDRAENVRDEDPVYYYLRAVVAYKTGRKGECLKWIGLLEDLAFQCDGVDKLQPLAESM